VDIRSAKVQLKGELEHIGCIMSEMLGLGKLDRKRLVEVLRSTKGTVSVKETADILRITATEAAKMLSRWAKKGWLSRVRRGLYIPIPLESRTADISFEDPWIIADRLFRPCYIGGWTAAGYWDLTEQIFRTIIVFTVQKPRSRSLTIRETEFLLHTIAKKCMFGLSSVWRGQVKVSVSDPTRTILDMLNDPSLAGGIRPMLDVITNYLKSPNKNIDLLLQYANRLNNGAVFKRLGFLLEIFVPEEKIAIKQCLSKLTKGNARLDPKLDDDKLITRWRLWLPRGFSKHKIMEDRAFD